MTSLQTWDSPIGPLHLVATDTALCAIVYPPMWDHFRPRLSDPHEGDSAVLRETRTQLEAYFAGERHTFDLPLDPAGTLFQRRAWQALAQIPYGQTRTYKEQATLLGSPAACRAVGRANGHNPLSIVVPCHRVVGSSGALTGYAGGLHAKSYLLEHERRVLRGR